MRRIEKLTLKKKELKQKLKEERKEHEELKKEMEFKLKEQRKELKMTKKELERKDEIIQNQQQELLFNHD